MLLLVSVHVSADAGYYGGYGGYGYGVTELAHGYVHTVYYAGYGGYGYGKRSAEADADPGHKRRHHGFYTGSTVRYVGHWPGHW